MNTERNEAFEAFLVEDVILTLGTVRGAFDWLASGEGCPPAARAEGFARISRQLAALEDRARDLWRVLQRGPAASIEPEASDNVFDLGAAPLPPPPRAVFRSRRGEA